METTRLTLNYGVERTVNGDARVIGTKLAQGDVDYMQFSTPDGDSLTVHTDTIRFVETAKKRNRIGFA